MVDRPPRPELTLRELLEHYWQMRRALEQIEREAVIRGDEETAEVARRGLGEPLA